MHLQVYKNFKCTKQKQKTLDNKILWGMNLIQYGVGSHPALYITKKGALDSQPQVIKFTSFLPMVGGSLRLLPSLKRVAMI